jgi:DNA repair protein RecO (recombination protein O)
MPLRETEAIVLRTYRLGEADKIASLFARQMGRLRGVARGARRPKSRFGAALEPLSYIRLWIFERENRDLLRLNSAELIESFFAMQQDYRVQVAAQYVAEVAERFLPEREVNERVFRLLLAVLRAFRSSGQVTRPLLYFNYWMLRLGGFLPDFDRCAGCGRELGDEPGYYGPGSEGLLCRLCRTGATELTVSPGGLRFAATARQSTLEHWMEAQEIPPGCREAQRFLEEVIQSHAEKPLATRCLLSEQL